MSKLIIVCGLPGTGKTTTARELSKKLNIVCYHKDSIKENLYEILGLSTLEDSKKIGKSSVEILLRLAEEQIMRGVDIIIESPFNFSEDYPQFCEWRKKYNLELYSIICSIDEKEREERVKNRPRHQAHHDAERIIRVNMKPEDGNIYENLPGKKIRVTTNIPTMEIINKIIKLIR